MKVVGYGNINKLIRSLLMTLFFAFNSTFIVAQYSVARQWSEVMLNCIRKDYARPTVQARTIAHASWAMYDAFAVYDDQSEPFLLGKTVGTYTAPFNGIEPSTNIQAAQEMAMSYAMYRFLTYRFQAFTPPGSWQNFMSVYLNDQMIALEYDVSITSTDYSDGDPAKLGNYIAQQLIAYGLTDGTNRLNNHANQHYFPVNGNIWADLPGNPECYDPNRWQPLALTLEISDQTGFPVSNGAPALTAEWGDALPFSMTPEQMIIKTRDNQDWKIYLDQGDPPYLDTNVQTGIEDLYKWGFVTNVVWHAMHSTSDNVMIDISPNSIGNLQTLPETLAEFPDFYDTYNGGPDDPGYTINPATGQPYVSQIVPRGDYCRVLSEFWADGPSSETPPGHWVKLFNEVSDHPLLEKKWNGEGEILSDLEWDVRGYFALCSGMYDAAIACWSAKGYYDYTRPIMALRYMAEKGQSTDPMLPHYHPAGLPIISGYIELVNADDPLVGDNMENLHKIKFYTWMGPLVNAELVAGVGWILGENWMTFQERNFVTPPFPGYYSGHSTYSRTGAEIMQLITGDEYFPGGMSEFTALENEYLQADQGPSTTIHLQWAKYKDASDQCSLSRIYGGLHPPQDDVPGRKVGMILGPQVFEHADQFISAGVPHITSIELDNLINDDDDGNVYTMTATFSAEMNTSIDPVVTFPSDDPTLSTLAFVDSEWLNGTQYELTYLVLDANVELNNVRFKIAEAQSLEGTIQLQAMSQRVNIDTRNPTALVNLQAFPLTDASVGSVVLSAEIIFDEAMNTSNVPVINFPSENGVSSFSLNNTSMWLNNLTYNLVLNGVDNNQDLGLVDIQFVSAKDLAGNSQVEFNQPDAILIQTKNPLVSELESNENVITQANYGEANFSIIISFDEMMNTELNPQILFPDEEPASVLTLNTALSTWINTSTFEARYDVDDVFIILNDIDIACIAAEDVDGNELVSHQVNDFFSINTTVGVDEFSNENAFLVYPNPVVSGNEVSVICQNSGEHFTISLYNTLGQTIFAKSYINPIGNRINIPTKGAGSGMYFLKCIQDGRALIVPIYIIQQ